LTVKHAEAVPSTSPTFSAASDSSSLRMVIRDIRRADSWIDYGFAAYPGGWNRTKD